MMPLNLSQWQQFCDGQLIGQDIVIQAVQTDTRKIQAGALFVALRGENFDGHDYLEQAFDKGASALLVEEASSLDIPQIVVENTRVALGLLGKGLRQKLQTRCCSMTGSNGKTTVKELCTSIMQQQFNVLATAGNFNNDIGVPLTLLNLEPAHQRAVVELGANHAGEIAYTSGLVAPEVGLINNIAAAHIEGFESVAGVAAAKSELFQNLAQGALAIAPLNHEWRTLLDEAASHCNREYFDLNDANADYYASGIEFLGLEGSEFTLHSPLGHARIRLQLAGQHNICNALAASAIAIGMGCTLDDVVQGLNQAQSVQGRLNMRRVNRDITLIDDSYNANPQSYFAAIKLLSAMPGRRILVAGDMAELGNTCEQSHREVAQSAFDAGLEFWSFGKYFEQFALDNQQRYTQQPMLIENLVASLKPTATTVLVKGSRSAAMEQVAQAIIHNFSENNEC